MTAFPLATGAWLEILRAGGNELTRRWPRAWTLCVCEPHASGLGGQTVLLVRFANGQTQSIDGHSHAPAVASLSTIQAGEQPRRHRACTIPSTPATLDRARRNTACLAGKWWILASSECVLPGPRPVFGLRKFRKPARSRWRPRSGLAPSRWCWRL
ncbi:gamma-glutamyltransferase [Mesorhizobium sp.]|uniref:gamma-glutamyltransferase n=1 Tax=Mesorhizobium sp. TaxID=1871066 RepID=UPI00257C8B21|nr:gamma-glutamyltransferase [Mesorhizobium sp.]